MIRKWIMWMLCFVIFASLFFAQVALAADPVCEIVGGAQYETLDAAIDTVPANTPTTIRLLQTINLNTTLYIGSAKKITLDLNNFQLNINTASGAGLEVCYEASITTTGSGSLNATGVLNGVFAHDDGDIDIKGDAIGTGNTADHGNGAGADAVGTGCSVTVNGNVTGDMRGVGAFGGSVTVTGDVSAYKNTVYANSGGDVHITGNIAGGEIGIYAHAAEVRVTGNVVANSAGSTGIFAYGGAKVDITGNVDAVRQGVSADASEVDITGSVTTTDNTQGFAACAENGSQINIGGNATGGPYGVFADTGGDITVVDGNVIGYYSGITVLQGATVAVGGNVIADGTVGVGVNAFSAAEVTIDGYIQAYEAMTFGESDGALVTPTTKAGYFTYSDGGEYPSFVWLKDNTPVLPAVTTNEVDAAGVTENTAPITGSVTADGGAAVTQRGFVYGTSANPTTADSKVVSGSGTGVFSTTLTGLSPGIIYHVRAFAVNSAGTGYGEDRTFTTKAQITGLPDSKTIYTGGRLTLTPSPAGGQWQWDSTYLSLTESGDGSAEIKGLKAGTTTATYTVGGVSKSVTVIIKASELPLTGQNVTAVWVLTAVAAIAVIAACLVRRRRVPGRR